MLPRDNTEKSAAERAFERLDVRTELSRLDQMLEVLRMNYEQYFTGILPLAPDKLHNEVKRLRRQLLKAPFKNSEMHYRLRTIEHRYQTYRSYWERVDREREAGTYSKDVFKAELREKEQLEQERRATREGQAEDHLKGLFKSYTDALEAQAGKKLNVNYAAFAKTVMQRAKQLREQQGLTKISFKIVVEDGKVKLIGQGK